MRPEMPDPLALKMPDNPYDMDPEMQAVHKRKMLELAQAQQAEKAQTVALKRATEMQQRPETGLGIGNMLSHIAGGIKGNRAQRGLERAMADQSSGMAAQAEEEQRRVLQKAMALRNQQALGLEKDNYDARVNSRNTLSAEGQEDAEFRNDIANEQQRREESTRDYNRNLRGDAADLAKGTIETFVNGDGDRQEGYLAQDENGRPIIVSASTGEPLVGYTEENAAANAFRGTAIKDADYGKLENRAYLHQNLSALDEGLTDASQVQIGGLPLEKLNEMFQYVHSQGLMDPEGQAGFLKKFGKDTSRQMRWFADYQKFVQAMERHELYGAQLTEHEAKFFREGESIFKGGNFEEIKARIAHFRDISNRRWAAGINNRLLRHHGAQGTQMALLRMAEDAGLEVYKTSDVPGANGQEVYQVRGAQVGEDKDGKPIYNTDAEYTRQKIQDYYDGRAAAKASTSGAAEARASMSEEDQAKFDGWDADKQARYLEYLAREAAK